MDKCSVELAQDERDRSRDYKGKGEQEEHLEEAALFNVECRAEANAMGPQLVDLEPDTASESGDS